MFCGFYDDIIGSSEEKIKDTGDWSKIVEKLDEMEGKASSDVHEKKNLDQEKQGYSQNSHCSYCGARFPEDTPWPRSCDVCNHKSYLNPLPVVVVLLPVGEGVLLIRRNIEPQKGTLTLPGGYIDFGETWQEAGVRELLEETGIEIRPEELKLYEVMNGLDNTLIVFGLGPRLPLARFRETENYLCDEVQEVVIIDAPRELGFEMHTLVVDRYFKHL